MRSSARNVELGLGAADDRSMDGSGYGWTRVCVFWDRVLGGG